MTVSKVKETKELLLALVALGAFVKERVQDGVDMGDAMALGQALVLPGQLKTLVEAGYRDVEKVGEELGSMGLTEYIELAALLPEMLKLLQPKKA